MPVGSAHIQAHTRSTSAVAPAGRHDAVRSPLKGELLTASANPTTNELQPPMLESEIGSALRAIGRVQDHRSDGETARLPSSVGSSFDGRPLGPWSFSNTRVSRAVDAAAVPPPTGEALDRSLSEAVARCVRSLPAEQDELLIDKLSSFVFNDTARAFVAAVRCGEDADLAELKSANPGSLAPGDTAHPRQFHMLTYNGRTSWGGMACYRGDIFPEGFYRTRASDSVAPSGLEKKRYVHGDASLLFEQPYFRWENGRYEFRLGDANDNATLRIVEHLAAQQGERITLWRGTRDDYDTPEELRVLDDDGRYHVGSMSSFGDDFASVMTTPDRSVAEKWANPVVVKFHFTAQELKDLAGRGLLYAGIEFDYIEMALLYDRDPKSGIGQASIDRMVALSAP